MADLSFRIQTSADFFQKLKEDYADYFAEQSSQSASRHAINCAMTAWHLIDWTYRDTSQPHTKAGLKFHRTKLRDLCPDLRIMNDIADGTKHCGLDRDPNVEGTAVHGGFSSGFGNGFSRGKLVVKMKGNICLDFKDSIERVIRFWEGFFANRA